MTYLETWAERFPDDPEYRRLLAEAYNKVDRHQDALSVIEEIPESNMDAEAFRLKAEVLVGAGR